MTADYRLTEGQNSTFNVKLRKHPGMPNSMCEQCSYSRKGALSDDSVGTASTCVTQWDVQ